MDKKLIIELAEAAGFEVLEGDNGSVIVEDREGTDCLIKFSELLIAKHFDTEVERLRGGYRRLRDASDIQMGDGDLARDIADEMLKPPNVLADRPAALHAVGPESEANGVERRVMPHG